MRSQAMTATPLTAERLAEIEALARHALNECDGKRPPYGETEARFYVDSARSVLANLEHASPTQETSDTLFVELRCACDEVDTLRHAVYAVPGLIAEVRQLRDDLDHATCADGDHLSKASRRMVETVMSDRDALREQVRHL